MVFLRHPYAGAKYILSGNRGLSARWPLLSLCGIVPPFRRQSFGYNRPLPSHAPQDRLSRLFATLPTIRRGCHPLRLAKPSIRCHRVGYIVLSVVSASRLAFCFSGQRAVMTTKVGRAVFHQECGELG